MWVPVAMGLLVLVVSMVVVLCGGGRHPHPLHFMCPPVKLMVTEEIKFNILPTLVDGIAAKAGDRVAVTGQSRRDRNGVYTVQGPGSWERSADGVTRADGSMLWVQQGERHGGTLWTACTRDAGPVEYYRTCLDLSGARGRRGDVLTLRAGGAVEWCPRGAPTRRRNTQRPGPHHPGLYYVHASDRVGGRWYSNTVRVFEGGAMAWRDDDAVTRGVRLARLARRVKGGGLVLTRGGGGHPPTLPWPLLWTRVES